MILIPDIVIYDTIKGILAGLKSESNSSSTDTFLHSIYGTEKKLDRFVFLTEAKKIFGKDIVVNFGYNLQVTDTPSIHIVLPSETQKPFALGNDQNYQEPVAGSNNKTLQQVYTASIDANYQLIITSPNSSEVVCMYHTLRACLLSISDHLEFSGLRLTKVSGQELMIQSDLVPPNIFHRSLALNFEYEVSVKNPKLEWLVKFLTINQVLE